jgi:hypothetical protein
LAGDLAGGEEIAGERPLPVSALGQKLGRVPEMAQ